MGSSIRHSRILAEGIPLAGNGKFPHISTKTIIAILHSVFFGTPSRESVLGSSIRQSRILAGGLPLAGNGKLFFFGSLDACVHILHLTVDIGDFIRTFEHFLVYADGELRFVGFITYIML